MSTHSRVAIPTPWRAFRAPWLALPPASAGCLVCAALAVCSPAKAGPTGGQVAAGAATISNQAGTTQVQQTTHRAIVNWRSFDVSKGEAVIFNQPSANALTLNRVTGEGPSSIFGSVTANGRIFIVNPHGMVFGPTAQFNVAGLVATTADINDARFMEGRYEFFSPGGQQRDDRESGHNCYYTWRRRCIDRLQRVQCRQHHR